jgi:hypothetical protein
MRGKPRPEGRGLPRIQIKLNVNDFLARKLNTVRAVPSGRDYNRTESLAVPRQERLV